MRVLWVTREFPDAHGSGAQVHQFELLRAVAASHQISIISSFWDISREALLRVQEMGVRVEVVPWPWNRMSRGRIRRVARLLRGAAPNFVASAMVGQVRPLSQAVAAHELYRPVDLVCILQGDLAPVADVTNAPTALFLFDVVSRQADLVLSQDGLSLRSVRRRLERRTALRWEPLWYRKADSVACVSSVDAAIVAKMLDRNVLLQRQRWPSSARFLGNRMRIAFDGSAPTSGRGSVLGVRTLVSGSSAASRPMSSAASLRPWEGNSSPTWGMFGPSIGELPP